jgi:hypothetical protein
MEVVRALARLKQLLGSWLLRGIGFERLSASRHSCSHKLFGKVSDVLGCPRSFIVEQGAGLERLQRPNTQLPGEMLGSEKGHLRRAVMASGYVDGREVRCKARNRLVSPKQVSDGGKARSNRLFDLWRG